MDFELGYEISVVTSMTSCLALSICVIHEYNEEMIFCACDSSYHCALMCVLTVVMSKAIRLT